MSVCEGFCFIFFFFNDTATTEIYTLSLHDALPICPGSSPPRTWLGGCGVRWRAVPGPEVPARSAASSSAESPRPRRRTAAPLCRTRAGTSASVAFSDGVPAIPGACPSARSLAQQREVVGSRRGRHLRGRQVRIVFQIQPRRALLDPAQQQVLDGIKGDGWQPQGIVDGPRYFRECEGLQQSQRLYVFAFALLTQAGLHQPAQFREALWQNPPGERRRLVQRVGLV